MSETSLQSQFNFGQDSSQLRAHYTVPKAEMHVHISLALNDETFLRRVKQRRTNLTPDFLLERNSRYYKDLRPFHEMYEGMTDMTHSPEEMAFVVQAYLERIAQEGAIYAEISNSYRQGAGFEAQMEGIEAGIKAAKLNTGIESRVVVTTLRDHGPEKAEEAARYLAKRQFEKVTCFGLVGDESKNSMFEFKRAFDTAWHDAGLGLSPHVAEQHLHNAVDFLDIIPDGELNLDSNDRRRVRAGHATLIHASTDLMKEFADRGICIESCLSANKRIGLPNETKALYKGQELTLGRSQRRIKLDKGISEYYDDIHKHPLRKFVKRKIPVCLGSDNPLLMNTSIGKEYTLAVKNGLSGEKRILKFTSNALYNSNIEPDIRRKLLGHVEEYKKKLKRGERPANTALGYVSAEQFVRGDDDAPLDDTLDLEARLDPMLQ